MTTLAWNGYRDLEPSMGDKANDADCDSFTADDCDDTDPVTTVATDGTVMVLLTIDCNDADENTTVDGSSAVVPNKLMGHFSGRLQQWFTVCILSILQDILHMKRIVMWTQMVVVGQWLPTTTIRQKNFPDVSLKFRICS